MKNTSKKDPFDFDDVKVTKKEWTREEIKKWEAGDLQKYLCKVDDVDFARHIEFLKSILDDVLKSEITKKPVKVFASTSTETQVRSLMKNIPQMDTVDRPEVPEGADAPTIEKLQKTYDKAKQAAQEGYKKALKKFRDECYKDLRRIAKNNVVGTLCHHGERRLLIVNRLIVPHKNSDDYSIERDHIAQYGTMTSKIAAYRDLCSKRVYAKQQELIEMGESVANSMQV